jgi:uncharacterized RDD family membrane protein YckC
VLDVVLAAVTLGIGWLVWSLARTWKNGQSPAKSLLGLRVVKADTGETATWGTMFVREVIGKWILGFLFPISVVMILVSPSRQGIWDKIAGTTVVEVPSD